MHKKFKVYGVGYPYWYRSLPKINWEDNLLLYVKFRVWLALRKYCFINKVTILVGCSSFIFIFRCYYDLCCRLIFRRFRLESRNSISLSKISSNCMSKYIWNFNIYFDLENLVLLEFLKTLKPTSVICLCWVLTSYLYIWNESSTSLIRFE